MTMLSEQPLRFTATICEGSGGGAYVPVPLDIKAQFGKGRLRVHATFDGEPYVGSIVNMGVKNEDGSVCYILGMLKSIRTKLGKTPGDSVAVVIEFI